VKLRASESEIVTFFLTVRYPVLRVEMQI
jgi:hypothetical protein